LKNNQILKTLLIAIFTAVIVLSCNKDDDKPIAEIDKLPPATQTGANTAGCLVNGEALLPKGNVQGGNLVLNYFGTDFTFGFTERINNQSLRRIRIVLYNLESPLNVNEVTNLETNFFNDNARAGFFAVNSGIPPDPNAYETNETITGELLITHHDFDNAILSGTFWFDAINSEGEIIEVREGRFDVEY